MDMNEKPKKIYETNGNQLKPMNIFEESMELDLCYAPANGSMYLSLSGWRCSFGKGVTDLGVKCVSASWSGS